MVLDLAALAGAGGETALLAAIGKAPGRRSGPGGPRQDRDDVNTGNNEDSTGTVARHNFDARVFAKLGRLCFGLSIRQQIHNLIALQVDQDGSIAITAAPGSIVDGEDPRRRHGACIGSR